LRALIVTNMYPSPAAPDHGTFVAAQVESLRGAGVHVDLLHLTRLGGGRRVYRDLSRRVTNAVQATQPDVVHVMYGGVMADVTTRAIRDRPVVVSYCGTDLLGGRTGGTVSQLALRYGVFASRRAARRAAGIVVKSRNLFDALPTSVDRTRVWIIPNGVDFSRFRPRDQSECRRELGWEQSRRHVLFPAVATRPEKRFALAQAAVAALNGAGSVELHALSGVPNAEVPVWMNAADVVVLTSTHEGSPNAVKEALACNVPVVSVDVGDVRDRFVGIEGCFIAEATPEDLAAKLEMVFARSRPVEAREHLAELSLQSVAERLQAVYELVAAAR
jgi:teichuronic acid biosynthesis glycosyltransferase TuaC